MTHATSFRPEDAGGFALGAYAISGAYGVVDAAAGIRTIRHFVERGGRIIDTADLYGDGANEELVGAAIRECRDHVQICTKFGFVYGDSMDTRRLDGRPKRVAEACDASLRRLRVDHIDLYYLHRVDPNVPVEDTVGAMARLAEAGKIRAIGLCEVGGTVLQRAVTVAPVAAIQSEYSLLAREPEALFDRFERSETAFYGYSPLGRGLLTARLRDPSQFHEGDQRRDLPRFQGENFHRNLALVDELAAIARAHGTTAAAMAIRWCTRPGSFAIPVIGATEPAHIDEAFAAIRLDVPADIFTRITELFRPENIAGERYSAAAAARLKAALD